MTNEKQPGRRIGRNLLNAVMRGASESDKREVGRQAMRKWRKGASSEWPSIRAIDPIHVCADKKRGSIRRWSLMKVVAAGRGRRKRRLPFGSYRGRRFGSDPVSGNTGPREEDAVRRLSDTTYMRVAACFSNAEVDMSAMRLAQGRSVCLTQTKTFWRKFRGVFK